MKGIDVSHHQGDIDWGEVKKSGVEFAILRAMYGLEVDKRFLSNVRGCQENGIEWGVYHYSYAKNGIDSRTEALGLYQFLKNKDLHPTYPLFFDWEEPSLVAAAKNTGKADDIAMGWCKTLEDLGYYVGIYTNYSMHDMFYTEGNPKWYACWIARWGDVTAPVDQVMWQYSNKGRVLGIKGDVDLDKSYVDFPEIIKARGLNGFVAK